MFDILVYLYETYYRPDACPEPAVLARKLSAVGFDDVEISEALVWLTDLNALAGEHGRDVYALPGSIHSALAKGCHALIKQGAKLVESVDDVLQELQWAASVAGTPAAAEDDGGHPLLAALGHDPQDADTLGARSGLAMGEVMGQLLALELAGRVERLPGGLFQRCK